MIFKNIRTQDDIRKLKKHIMKDAAYSALLDDVCSKSDYTKNGQSRATLRLGQGRGVMPTNAELLSLYRSMVDNGVEERNSDVELALRKIKTKSNSGVAVVSLLTKPFPCPGRCTYCPSDVRMPKSYLAQEPAAARALAHEFDPYRQATARLRALEANGHPIDKVEIIVIGGTWSHYHHAYQEEFMIGVYRACNDYNRRKDSREREYHERQEYLSALQDENERAICRIVGLSIETRPDRITEGEIARLRTFGVTKVEIGVQHLDDDVLKEVKRDMTIADVKHATEILRNAGLKVVYHMMPNLPGSTVARDQAMFTELFSGPDFQPDMLKIYPCVVLESTALFETWKKEDYTPYTDQELLHVLRHVKKKIPPYVRILRVIRDIPASYIKAGNTMSNFRQLLERDMRENDWHCRCIRCREVRESMVDPNAFTLSRIDYRTLSGTEIFLSWEDSMCDRIASFARLRLPDNKGKNSHFSELKEAAIIRELHTYGRHTPIGAEGSQSQHVGFGRKLVAEAERIARDCGYTKLAIISGVGVREYYKKLGYHREGTYMVKLF